MEPPYRIVALIAAVTLLLLRAEAAFAWNAAGHTVVGEIAERLLPPAVAEKVHKGLAFDHGPGHIGLGYAARWADCVKCVNPVGSAFIYDLNNPYAGECADFIARGEQARMEDYVRRNWTQCIYAGKPERCHNSYHFTDVDIIYRRYRPYYIGAFPADIVATINSAIAYLHRRPDAAIVNIRDDKEALLLLAHFIGDLHQPLHVGSVYLAGYGQVVHPQTETQAEATTTIGGNAIQSEGGNLYSEWDAVENVADLDRLRAPTKFSGMMPRMKGMMPCA